MRHGIGRRGLLKGAALASCGAALGSGEGAAGATVPRAAPSPRTIVPLDRGWRFHLGHACDPAQDFGFGASHDTYGKSGDVGTPAATIGFDDAGWQAVDLPHDWAVDLPFARSGAPGSDADKAGAAQGYKPLGRLWPATSVGWYRRPIAIEAADAGRRLSLEFDGVSRDCLVMLNGFVVGSNESGYAPFRIDITDFAKPGEPNILVLRCDMSLGEAWSYEGAGLYRHVRLVKTAPTHVRQWGAAVRTTVTPAGAQIRIATEIDNDGPAATAALRSILLGPDGVERARCVDPVALPAWGAATVAQTTLLAEPALWSLETPHCHRLVSEILIGGRVVDRDETVFGIRTIVFDPDRGLFLNGVHTVVKGTCNHQDHAGVGFAVPDSLHVWRLERLKAMGSNAYRSTHHPPAPAILDACDRMGILVLDETRQMSSDAEGMSQLERMVRRDRNHPCVFLWSIGNEEIHRGTPTGARIATTMKRRVNTLDGTRLVTEAMNGQFGKGASDVLDVVGFNYYLGEIDAFHASHPRQPTIGTETASTVMTRGAYARDDAAQLVPAYDAEFPRWASTAERWWTFYAERPFIAGGFVWTGFDYKGEPTPFDRWPSNASNFGQLDSCGFPKDDYWYYRAWWGDAPVLHLFPHWNWAGREGKPVSVWVHSNLEAVELLVNGVSVGRKPVVRNRHLEWSVPYAPGAIEARGFQDGRHVTTARRETTGPAHAVAVSSDRRVLAPGDVAVVRTAIVDAQGREVPTASNRVRFALSGDARLLGVGNGDPRSLEPDHATARSAFNGLCMALVQAGDHGGTIRLVAQADGLVPAMLPLATRT
ncbi:beta-galactosidase GalA [Sphingomonas sp. CROZ-RG-20F-R02-07]|uniref:beta-galactosidase GalA n=1 Tax=Sphingomonas sp. CROZ-RG-20F-R02-07 TaxID=2914832 RepID=UPI001F576B27|nr:beta-galactosidase GalA [Sphingomonas sp. CROZ-RG-20F-R02-07]